MILIYTEIVGRGVAWKSNCTSYLQQQKSIISLLCDQRDIFIIQQQAQGFHPIKHRFCEFVSINHRICICFGWHTLKTIIQSVNMNNDDDVTLAWVLFQLDKLAFIQYLNTGIGFSYFYWTFKILKMHRLLSIKMYKILSLIATLHRLAHISGHCAALGNWLLINFASSFLSFLSSEAAMAILRAVSKDSIGIGPSLTFANLFSL